MLEKDPIDQTSQREDLIKKRKLVFSLVRRRGKNRRHTLQEELQGGGEISERSENEKRSGKRKPISKDPPDLTYREGRGDSRPAKSKDAGMFNREERMQLLLGSITSFISKCRVTKRTARKQQDERLTDPVWPQHKSGEALRACKDPPQNHGELSSRGKKNVTGQGGKTHHKML